METQNPLRLPKPSRFGTDEIDNLKAFESKSSSSGGSGLFGKPEVLSVCFRFTSDTASLVTSRGTTNVAAIRSALH